HRSHIAGGGGNSRGAPESENYLGDESGIHATPTRKFRRESHPRFSEKGFHRTRRSGQHNAVAQRKQETAPRSRARLPGTAPKRVHRPGQRRETSLWNERWARRLAVFLQSHRESESTRTRG